MQGDWPDWRSSEDYDYTDDLVAQEWAWEFLRRNPQYQEAWRKLKAAQAEFSRRYDPDHLTEEHLPAMKREAGMLAALGDAASTAFGLHWACDPNIPGGRIGGPRWIDVPGLRILVSGQHDYPYIPLTEGANPTFSPN